MMMQTSATPTPSKLEERIRQEAGFLIENGYGMPAAWLAYLTPIFELAGRIGRRTLDELISAGQPLTESIIDRSALSPQHSAALSANCALQGFEKDLLAAIGSAWPYGGPDYRSAILRALPALVANAQSWRTADGLDTRDYSPLHRITAVEWRGGSEREFLDSLRQAVEAWWRTVEEDALAYAESEA